MKSKQKGYLQQALPPGAGISSGRVHNLIQKGFSGLIMIAWLITLLLLSQIRVNAQSTNQGQRQTQKQISGTVLTEAHTPVIGATVTVLATKTGTVTDDAGKFTLEVNENDTLSVSYVGYQTQKVAVGGKNTLEIVLPASNSNQLEDVITVGYGTQKKTDVTGAITSVPESRLSQLPVTNVMQAVEGAVAGVSVTNTSSVPGSSPAVMIRGQNSITASSGPYIIVDGLPLIKTQGNPLNDINPNDIASIEVLKDASATAIYGTNGSNGVILITTKRGLTGKAVIRYNGYAGIENLAHVLKPRDGASYIQKYADYLSQTGQTQTSPVPNSSELDNYNAGSTTDWMDEVTRTGIMQDHNLSVSGGTADVKYYVGGELMQQKGVILGYQYQRVNLRSNLDIRIAKFLKIGMSSLFTSNNYDGGRANLLLATAMSPYGNEYNEDGSYNIYPMYPEELYVNPLLGLTTDQQSRSVNINGNAYAELDLGGLVKGLRYRLNAGYIYFPERSASYTGRAANDLLGTASITNAHTNNYTLENLLYYNHDWNKHHLDFTGLYSAQQRKYITTTATAKGFVNDIIGFNSLASGATQNNSSYSDRYALNSQMVRFNYNYDSRYLVTLTARRDGSSVFGANTSKYGIFPSAAIGWNISKEAFMQDADFVDNLKLRVSYGKTGNEAISVYKTITTDNTIQQPFNGVTTVGAVAGNLGNNDLHWESTKTLNLGLDFGLFNGRISGAVDFYKNNTYDLLLSRHLPIITGYTSVLDNLGKTSNTGLELSLNTKNIDRQDFKWQTAIVFSSNQNKLKELYGDGLDDIGNGWFLGHPISVIYNYVLEGVWQQGEDPSKQDPGAKPGDLKFKDVSGPDGKPDGQITADDKVILGQTTPKWQGGLTNRFEYKNFSLSIFFQTTQGQMKYNPDLTYGDETGRRNTPQEIGYWTPENKSNTRPSLAYNNTRGYGFPSDASYTRLKDITLSYTFDKDNLSRLGLSSLTIYASGKNLHTFTNWVGWDPEDNYSSRGSGDWTNNYPMTRSFVLGVNIALK